MFKVGQCTVIFSDDLQMFNRFQFTFNQDKMRDYTFIVFESRQMKVQMLWNMIKKLPTLLVKIGEIES